MCCASCDGRSINGIGSDIGMMLMGQELSWSFVMPNLDRESQALGPEKKMEGTCFLALTMPPTPPPRECPVRTTLEPAEQMPS